MNMSHAFPMSHTIVQFCCVFLRCFLRASEEVRVNPGAEIRSCSEEPLLVPWTAEGEKKTAPMEHGCETMLNQVND
jgi:hypothetical protein